MPNRTKNNEQSVVTTNINTNTNQEAEINPYVLQEYNPTKLNNEFLKQNYGDSLNNNTKTDLKPTPIDYNKPIKEQIQNYDGINTAPTKGNFEEVRSGFFFDGDTIKTDKYASLRLKGLSTVESVVHSATTEQISKLPFEQQAEAYKKLSIDDRVKSQAGAKAKTALKYMMDNYKIIAINKDVTPGEKSEMDKDIHGRRLINDALLQDKDGNITSMKNLMLQFGIGVDSNGNGGKELSPDEKARDIAQQEATRYTNNVDEFSKSIDIEKNSNKNFMDNLKVKLRKDYESGKISEYDVIDVYNTYEKINKQNKTSKVPVNDIFEKTKGKPLDLINNLLYANANNMLRRGDKLSGEQTKELIKYYLDPETGGIKDKLINRDNPEKQRAILNTIIQRFGDKTENTYTKTGKLNKKKDYFQFNDMNSRKAVVVNEDYLTKDELETVDNQGSLGNILEWFSKSKNRKDVLTDIGNIAVQARTNPSNVIQALDVRDNPDKFFNDKSKSKYSLINLNKIRGKSNLKPYDMGINLGIDVKGEFFNDLTSFDSTMVEHLLEDTLNDKNLSLEGRTQVKDMIKGLATAAAYKNNEFKNSATIMDKVLSRPLTKIGGFIDNKWDHIKSLYNTVSPNDVDKAYKEEADRLLQNKSEDEKQAYIENRKKINGDAILTKDENGILKPKEDVDKEIDNKWENIEKSTGYNRKEVDYFINKGEAPVYPTGFTDTLITSGASIASLFIWNKKLINYVNDKVKEENLRGGSLNSFAANAIGGLGSGFIARKAAEKIAVHYAEKSALKNGELLGRLDSGFGTGTAILAATLDTGINTLTGAFSSDRSSNIFFNDKGEFDPSLTRRARNTDAGAFATGLAMNGVIAGTLHTAGKVFGKDIKDPSTGKYKNGLNIVYTNTIAPVLAKNNKFKDRLFNNIKEKSKELGLTEGFIKNMTFDDIKHIPNEKTEIIYMDAFKKALMDARKSGEITNKDIPQKAYENLTYHLNAMSNTAKLQFHRKFGEKWNKNINEKVSDHITKLEEKSKKLKEVKDKLLNVAKWSTDENGQTVDIGEELYNVDKKIEQLGKTENANSEELQTLKDKKATLEEIVENSNKTVVEIIPSKKEIKSQNKELSNTISSSIEKLRQLSLKEQNTENDKEIKNTKEQLWGAKLEQKANNMVLSDENLPKELAMVKILRQDAKDSVGNNNGKTEKAIWSEKQLKAILDKRNKRNSSLIKKSIDSKDKDIKSIEDSVKEDIKNNQNGKETVDEVNKEIKSDIQEVKDNIGSDVYNKLHIETGKDLIDASVDNQRIDKSPEQVEAEIKTSIDDNQADTIQDSNSLYKKTNKVSKSINKESFVKDIVDKFKKFVVKRAIGLDNSESNEYTKLFGGPQEIGKGKYFYKIADNEDEAKKILKEKTYTAKDGVYLSKIGKALSAKNKPLLIGENNSRLKVVKNYKDWGVIIWKNQKVDGRLLGDTAFSGIIGSAMRNVDMSYLLLQSDKRIIEYAEREGFIKDNGALNNISFAKDNSKLYKSGDVVLENSNGDRMNIFNIAKKAYLENTNNENKAMRMANNAFAEILGVTRQIKDGEEPVRTHSDMTDEIKDKLKQANKDAHIEEDVIEQVSKDNKINFRQNASSIIDKVIDYYNNNSDGIIYKKTKGDFVSKFSKNKVDGSYSGLDRPMSAVDFIMNQENMDMRTAVRKLYNILGHSGVSVTNSVVEKAKARGHSNGFMFKKSIMSNKKHITQAVAQYLWERKLPENIGNFSIKDLVRDLTIHTKDLQIAKWNPKDPVHIGLQYTDKDGVLMERQVGQPEGHSSSVWRAGGSKEGKRVFTSKNYKDGETADYAIVAESINDALGYVAHLVKDNGESFNGKNIKIVDMAGLPKDTNKILNAINKDRDIDGETRVHYAMDNKSKKEINTNNNLIDAINKKLKETFKDRYTSSSPENFMNDSTENIPKDWNEYAKGFDTVENKTKSLFQQIEDKINKKDNIPKDAKAESKAKGLVGELLDKINGIEDIFRKPNSKDLVGNSTNRKTYYDVVRNRITLGENITFRKVLHELIHSIQNFKAKDSEHSSINSDNFHKLVDILDKNGFKDFKNVDKFLKDTYKTYKDLIEKDNEVLLTGDRIIKDRIPLVARQKAVAELYAEMFNDAKLMEEMGRMKIKDDTVSKIELDNKNSLMELKDNSIVSKFIKYVANVLSKDSDKNIIPLKESLAYQIALELDNTISRLSNGGEELKSNDMRNKIAEHNLLYSTTNDIKEKLNIYKKITEIGDNFIKKVVHNGYEALDYKFRKEYDTSLEENNQIISKVFNKTVDTLAKLDERLFSGVGRGIAEYGWDLFNSSNISNKIIEDFMIKAENIPNEVNAKVEEFRKVGKEYIDNMHKDSVEGIPALIQIGLGYVSNEELRYAVEALSKNDSNIISKRIKTAKENLHKLENLLKEAGEYDRRESLINDIKSLAEYVTVHRDVDGTPHNPYQIAKEHFGDIIDDNGIGIISEIISNTIMYSSLRNKKVFNKLSGKLHIGDEKSVVGLFTAFKRATPEGYKIGRMGDIIDPRLIDKDITAISKEDFNNLPESDKRSLMRKDEYKVDTKDGYRYFYSDTASEQKQYGKLLPKTDYQNIDADVYGVTDKLLEEANKIFKIDDPKIMDKFIAEKFYNNDETKSMNVYPVIKDGEKVIGFKKVIPRNKSAKGKKIDELSAMQSIISDKEGKITRDVLQSKLFENANIRSSIFTSEEAEKNFVKDLKQSLNLKDNELAAPFIFIDKDAFIYTGDETQKFFLTNEFTSKYRKIANDERILLPKELQGETYIRKEFADNLLTYSLAVTKVKNELINKGLNKWVNALQLFKQAVTVGDYKTIMNGLVANTILLGLHTDSLPPVRKIVSLTKDWLKFEDNLLKLEEYRIRGNEDDYNKLKSKMEKTDVYKYHQLGFSNTIVDGVETDIRRAGIPLYRKVGTMVSDYFDEKNLNSKTRKTIGKVATELFLANGSKVRDVSVRSLRLGDSVPKALLYEHLKEKYMNKGMITEEASFKASREASEAFVNPRDNFDKGIAYADRYGVPFIGWWSNFSKAMVKVAKEKPTSTLLMSYLVYIATSGQDPIFRNESVNPLGTLFNPPEGADGVEIPNLITDAEYMYNGFID